jgi:phospholipase C
MKLHSRAFLVAAVVALVMFTQTLSAWSRGQTTVSPIKHLIVVVGENRSFDNVFATYTPSDPSQKVWNLLSRGIVLSTGAPRPNFALAAQWQASSTTTFELSPSLTSPFGTLPQPSTTLDGLPVGMCILTSVLYPKDPLGSDIGLDRASQGLLTVSGTGQPLYLPDRGLFPVPDCRYPSNLPNGPYSIVDASKLENCGKPVFVDAITPTTYVNYTGDPVHRFYQMWQQSNCSAAKITTDNPSGCTSDLYSWVGITVGWGVTKPPETDQDTFQGGISMGFYNMARGDWPYFLALAQNYAISDNYHQPMMGGTGANSQFMFTGDVYYYTDANGRPAVPPSGLIENPNPRPGTNNFYTNDAFGSVDPGSTGVGLTNCSDRTQPGVRAIMDYLGALPYAPFNGGNCAPGAWYQVNNNYPYYNTDGSIISAANNAFLAGPAYSIGPQTLPTIGDALSRRGISWRYYGGGLNSANEPAPRNSLYCGICNGFQYATSIMTTSLRANLVDLAQFYTDIANDTLPAVSFIKPTTLVDGHPGESTPPLFEAFVRKLITTVQANPRVWRDAAILVTFDEGGGLYDSGYIQPIDFFGGGPRTVLIAVSPYAKRGHVDHTYADHASILKFIEWNWRLKPLSPRSRDNLPNPIASPAAPYFPTNSPAIGDLRTMFDFGVSRH